MKILIVDDEAINRTLLTNMLFNAGYKECIEAVDGVEAIKKFTQRKTRLGFVGCCDAWAEWF